GRWARLSAGTVVIQCAETQSTAEGRGSVLPSSSRTRPLRRDRAPAWVTRARRRRSAGSSSRLRLRPRTMALRRDHQHAVDAPAVHIHYFEAEPLQHDVVSDGGNAVHLRHQEPSESMELAGVLAGQAAEAG